MKNEMSRRKMPGPCSHGILRRLIVLSGGGLPAVRMKGQEKERSPLAREATRLW